MSTLRATAYHEAGHAVAAWHLGLPFRYVTIEPDKRRGSLGHLLPHKAPTWLKSVEYNVTAANRDRVRKEIICRFSGPAAERKLTGRFNHRGANGDYRDSAHLADYLYANEKAHYLYLRIQRMEAAWLVADRHNWKAIRVLAGALLKQSRISADDAREIMWNATCPPGGDKSEHLALFHKLKKLKPKKNG